MARTSHLPRASRALAALLVACSSSTSGAEPGADGGASDATRTGGRDATLKDAPMTLKNPDGAGREDSSSTLGCSGDLRSIVDQSGTVVATCAPIEGCSHGKCIDACTAAAESHGSLGCDFWVGTPVTYDVEMGQAQPCFAMFVANSWPTTARFSVTRDGTAYDPTKFAYVPSQTLPPAAWPALPASGLPADDVAVLYLSGAPGVGLVEIPADSLSCPQPTATGVSTELVGTGKSSAFHVQSNVPVSAYDIFPFGGGHSFFPSAELLFPASAWGTNYVVLATPTGTASPSRLKFVDILAQEDGTRVTFAPSVALPGGGGYPAVAANTSTTFTLNAGEYAHWETPASSNDLSGSVVLAKSPVSVTAGEDFFRLQPYSEPGGEATHAQIAPASALASDYAVSPYVTRRADMEEESIAYRIVGIVAGTTLTFDPAVSGAPTTLTASQVSDFQVTGAFRVTSQDKDHPFSIAQVMSSGNVNVDGGAPGFRKDCATYNEVGFPMACGDEDFVPLVPPAQFLEKYVFFTDPTYSTTSIDLVRVKPPGAGSGFEDVTVDCLGTIEGWKPIGASGQYEYARADLLRAVAPGTMPDGGACANGRHVASSKAPFGLVVYGLDTYSSYGYPAGGNAAVLSGVVVKPPP